MLFGVCFFWLLQTLCLCSSSDKFFIEQDKSTYISFDKFFLGQTLNIHITNACLEQCMVHIKLINAYFMVVGNVCFFILSRGSHKILST